MFGGYIQSAIFAQNTYGSSDFVGSGGGGPDPGDWSAGGDDDITIPADPTYDYYVSTSGSDSNPGTLSFPFRTVAHACNISSGAKNIRIAAGTYTETSYIILKAGTSLYGAGSGSTIIQGHSSLYDSYPGSGSWKLDKFLIQASSGALTTGNNVLKDIQLNGSSGSMRGGLYVQNRINFKMYRVYMHDFNTNASWMENVTNGLLYKVVSYNSGWASFSFALGNIQLSNLNGFEMNRCTISEDTGYGIKGLHTSNPSITPNFYNVRIHHCFISVAPTSAWNGGSSPNISIEYCREQNQLQLEIDHCYVDNIISLVDKVWIYSATPTIHLHHNYHDIDGPRANGYGYGIEANIGGLEVFNSFFNGGSNAIVNWHETTEFWYIHQNVFYNIGSYFPTAAIEIYRYDPGNLGGLTNVDIYANTHHISRTSTGTYNSLPMETHFIEIRNGVDMLNVDIANNLVINTSGGASKFINEPDGGVSKTNVNVRYNFVQNVSGGIGALGGVTYTGNLSGTAGIVATGSRPDYYAPSSGGNLDEAGLNVGYSFPGSAPVIGALEPGESLGVST